MIKFYFELEGILEIAIAKVFPLGRKGGCDNKAPETEGSRYACTRPNKHLGPHVAHGVFNKAYAIWMGEYDE